MAQSRERASGARSVQGPETSHPGLLRGRHGLFARPGAVLRRPSPWLWIPAELAGNLLYNHRTGELSIIDWALRERLSRDQRRHLAVLLAMTGLRDPVGARNAVRALSQRRRHSSAETSQVVAEEVSRFFDELPASSLPSMVDVTRLLERIAFAGVRFPASLIMLSKVMFTLDGILRDLGASETSMGMITEPPRTTAVRKPHPQKPHLIPLSRGACRVRLIKSFHLF
jgi:predicted unusual protein kinase regulating ubiquinone biosynthesis (AarF/ABC1/UbiB family)